MNLSFLILEDEPISARRLANMLRELYPGAEILATLDSVEESLYWLQNNDFKGIICMDIQLSDGTCFDLLSRVPLANPVIFTTAYEHFLTRAFEANAMAYLLKPVQKQELESAVEKCVRIQGHWEPKDYAALAAETRQPQARVYLKRLLVKLGSVIRVVAVNEVLYFFTQNKIVYACMESGKKYPLDLSLDELEEQLNPAHFFRINRQFIVTPESISQIHTHTKSRLKLMLEPAFPAEMEAVVSYEKVNAFKLWLTGRAT